MRTIPGVSELTAQVIVSETGTDMSRFLTVEYMISWAGLYPRNDESAGKRRSNRLRMEDALAENDPGATRLGNHPQKGELPGGAVLTAATPARSGKAVPAVAASILTASYHMLQDGTFYQDLGADHSRRTAPKIVAEWLAAQVRKLGFSVPSSQQQRREFLFRRLNADRLHSARDVQQFAVFHD